MSLNENHRSEPLASDQTNGSKRGLNVDHTMLILQFALGGMNLLRMITGGFFSYKSGDTIIANAGLIF